MTKHPTAPAKTVSRPSMMEGDESMPQLKCGATPLETAKFIADFTTELSHLARQSRLDLLAYLLDMARLEATRVVQAHQSE